MIELRLVPLTEAHLPAVAAVAGEAQVARYTRFPVPIPPGWVEQWFQRYQAGRADGTREAFAAVSVADGRFLGLALAPGIDEEAREMELGYLVDPSVRRQGVATELLRQLTDWALRERQALRLTLMIDASNVGSIRAAERAGYRFEGTLRDAYVKPGIRADTQLWSRLASD